MNIRTIIIAIALLAPVAALAVLAQQADTPGKAAHGKDNSAKLENLSTAPAALPPTSGEQQATRARPASLEEAKARLKQRLADLEKMTPEQWEAEQKGKQQRPGRRTWDQLTPEEQLKVMERRQEKNKRLPDVPGKTANPPAELPTATKP